MLQPTGIRNCRNNLVLAHVQQQQQVLVPHTLCKQAVRQLI